MKYLKIKIISAILVATSLIVFYSCKKEKNITSTTTNLIKLLNGNPTSVSHSNIGLQQDFLYFENFNVFENTLLGLDTLKENQIDTWESYFGGFQSMRNYYNLLEEEDQSDTFLCPLFDESLSAVLNHEGIVRVDSVAFLLDFSDNSVYEVYPVNEATIDSLKLKNEINNDSMYLFKYSMEDEIFFPDDMVEANILKKNDGTFIRINNNKRTFKFLKKWWRVISGNGCDDKRGESKKDKGVEEFQDDNEECIHYKYKLKLKYQKSGLRFKVQAKAKFYKKNGCDEKYKRETGAVCFDGEGHLKRFCVNGWHNEYKYCYYSSGPIFGNNNNLSSTTFKTVFYNRGTRLSKYKVEGVFFLYNPSKNDVFYSRNYLIESNYP